MQAVHYTLKTFMELHNNSQARDILVIFDNQMTVADIQRKSCCSEFNRVLLAIWNAFATKYKKKVPIFYFWNNEDSATGTGALTQYWNDRRRYYMFQPISLTNKVVNKIMQDYPSILQITPSFATLKQRVSLEKLAYRTVNIPFAVNCCIQDLLQSVTNANIPPGNLKAWLNL
ncbi:MAG: hypothetical protein EZS28_030220 [Streblomastix strix]|uniref:Uncharacterized protein n=1 Tax=Streblomastix strix TaxID=222440 RepID=A0A5J4UVY7_9EUKA|nr:MAG: hypothetical protein EZS28_030220 [Streblomastix strix]